VSSYRAEMRQTRRQSRERIIEAATELVRRTSYGALTVDEVMREAGFGRTIFYRHFDDLADLLMKAGREAIESLFEASSALGAGRIGDSSDLIRAAIEPAVAVYEQHGPLLRAISEAAAAGDQDIAAGQDGMRRRFDVLLEAALRGMPAVAARPPSDIAETARALNLMNEAYLQDTFGREPKVSADVAAQTLTEIWDAVIHRGG
jgi:AcrR family transcriptional regulator